MLRKKQFIEDGTKAVVEGCSKIILGIRMPDGTKEIIINDNVSNKISYVEKKYDDNMVMVGCSEIKIEEYLFIKR